MVPQRYPGGNGAATASNVGLTSRIFVMFLGGASVDGD